MRNKIFNELEDLVNNNDYSVSLVNQISLLIDEYFDKLDDEELIANILDNYLMYYRAYIYTEDGEDYTENFLKYVKFLIDYYKNDEKKVEYWLNVFNETVEDKKLD